MKEKQLLELLILALYLLVVFAPLLFLIILFFKKNKEFHDKVLIAWIAVSAINSFIEFIKIAKPTSSIPFLLDLNKTLLLSNIFFFYWYCKNLFQSGFKWNPKLVWPLLPFLLWVVACFANWLAQGLFFNEESGYGSLTLQYGESFVWVEASFVLGILWIGLLFWFKIKEVEKFDVNGVQFKNIRNLKRIMITIVVVYLITAIWEFGLSDFLRGTKQGVLWTIVFLSTVDLLLVSLGFFFYKQKGLYKKRKGLTSTNQVLDTMFQKVEKLMMIEKPYLNPDLTISKLAVLLGETPQKVSEAIKLNTDHSFYAFINQYRVEEAKSLLKNSDYSSYSIVSIGLESGFNSKATFNRVFKKETGMTPSAYNESVNF
ncbi:MAG: AraC family transcriptional regulator [Bacteroidota bacterium]